MDPFPRTISFWGGALPHPTLSFMILFYFYGARWLCGRAGDGGIKRKDWNDEIPEDEGSGEQTVMDRSQDTYRE